MARVAMIIPLIFMAQAQASKPAANHDEVVDGATDTVIDKLVNNLFDRTLAESRFQRADLDDTTLEKPGQLAIPARARAVPGHLAIPAHASVIPGFHARASVLPTQLTIPAGANVIPGFHPEISRAQVIAQATRAARATTTRKKKKNNKRKAPTRSTGVKSIRAENPAVIKETSNMNATMAQPEGGEKLAETRQWLERSYESEAADRSVATQSQPAAAEEKATAAAPTEMMFQGVPVRILGDGAKLFMFDSMQPTLSIQ